MEQSQGSIGSRMAAAREAAGLKRSEVSRRTGVPQEVLWRYENDRAEPKAERVALIAKAIGCTTDAILVGEPEATSEVA